jgi:DNA polymerase III subunit beta
MLVTLLQENLQTSLNYLQRAIPTKPQLPILSALLLEITTTNCVLSATDLYLGIKATIPITSDGSYTIIVPGKQFKEIISSLNPGTVTLRYEKSTLSISSGKTKASLQCFVNEEYPPFPVVEGSDFSFSKEQLKVIETHIAFSSSSDQTRPILTTILFEFLGKTMKAVATDGFRLAVMEIENISSSYEGSLLIPARAIVEISRIMDQLQVDTLTFIVSQELKQVLFKVGSVEIYVRLITGEYPPYEKILPTNFSTEVSFDRKELLETVKQAMIFARDSSNIIQVFLTKEKVYVQASSSSLGSFERELEQVSFSGDDGELAFNSKYLLDFLTIIEEDTVLLEMSDSLKPVVFKTPGYDQFKYVVMPFKVNK